MLKKNDFHYEIPADLVAQYPADKRDSSRLLVCQKKYKSIKDCHFIDLPSLFKTIFPVSSSQNFKALFLMNDTRVYPARVRISRQTGAKGEVFLLEYGEKKTYKCLLRPLSKLKLGEVLYSDDGATELFRVESLNPPVVSRLNNAEFESFLNQYGEMPLPPYIDRNPKRYSEKNKEDTERYQTVYSEKEKIGSCAAPTAGLHFTEKIMADCRTQGIEFAPVTLHVGLGTFAPVQEEKIQDHPMHEEYYNLSQETLKKINEYLANDWPIVFVGTTSLRTVESFFRHNIHDEFNNSKIELPNYLKMLAKQNKLIDVFTKHTNNWLPTKLFLYPQNKDDTIQPAVGNGILTNFHQPESTLAMLVAALMGYSFWKEFYEYAIEKKYRFFSYGDSSLLIF